MTIHEIYQQLITDIHQAKWYEYVAVISGIASVWYSRKENILVYPVGLINTILYVYISVEGSLLGEAGVNLYYTIMSLIGWWQWLRKDVHQQAILHITLSNAKEWLQQLLFFGAWYISIFIALVYFKKQFLSGAIPWADAFAAATAFTGMWLMTQKKTGKLVLVDRHQYCSDPTLFCKTLCAYQSLLPRLAGDGRQRTYRMAQAHPLVRSGPLVISVYC